jgi:tungstate transport system substrate-binding protein
VAMRFGNIILGSLFLAAGAWFRAHAEDYPFITVASATSEEESGLIRYLLPVFTQRTGIDVYFVAMDTRQALKSGRLGECEVVLLHDRSQETQFVQSGFGSVRREVMYDDFVLVGPKDDPAKINATHDAVAALRKIDEVKALFVSGADMSDTAAAEQHLWTEAGGKPIAHYVETGSSVEHTLAMAASRNAYTLADRATWVRLKNHLNLKIVVDGDQRLIDQYSVILVNPAKHPQLRAELGMAFIGWLTSEDGQAAIANYEVHGEQVFFPDYLKR